MIQQQLDALVVRVACHFVLPGGCRAEPGRAGVDAIRLGAWLGRSIEFTVSANSIIHCAVGVTDMAVNRAAQKWCVCVSDAHAWRKYFVGAVLWCEVCPVLGVRAPSWHA